MLESKFVQQNKEKWSELESMLSRSNSDPEKLTEHFVRVSEDLSYARTHYPNRSVRLYLNQLTQRIFSFLYKNKKNNWKAIVQFWKYELPLTMYHARKELLVAFALFMIAMAIGIFSTKNDPGFARQILGDSYVNMTLENIQKDDPLAVYKKSKEMDMFLGITINNVRVALITFVLGVLAGVGSGAFLLYNGIMVGTFQYFFIQRDLFKDSFLTIWLHGALEISSIVLAATAGFALGKGLLFPGSYNRFQSFQVGARRGITIMLGIIPIFVLAAFIESYLTRYTNVHDGVRIAIIVLSFSFILYYFVWYPIQVARSPEAALFAFNEQPEPTQLQSEPQYGLRTFGETISATLEWMAKHAQAVFISIGISSFFLSSIWIFWLRANDMRPAYEFTSYWVANNFMQYLDFEEYHWKAFVPTSLVFGALQTYFFYLHVLPKEGKPKPGWGKWLIIFLKSWAMSGVLLALLFVPNRSTIILFALLVPFQVFWTAATLLEEDNPLSSFFGSISLQNESWRMVLGQNLVMLFLSFILSVLSNSQVVWLYFQFLTWNISENSGLVHQLSHFFVAFLTLFSMLFCYCFMYANSFFLYQNLRELHTCEALSKRITTLTLRKHAL